MNIQYLFPSSQGDIPLEQAQLALPFKMTPTREHPSLTLKDYFVALERFILMEGGKRLIRLLEKKLSRTIAADQIQGIRIYSEKHGILSLQYRISGVFITVPDVELIGKKPFLYRLIEILNFKRASRSIKCDFS